MVTRYIQLLVCNVSKGIQLLKCDVFGPSMGIYRGKAIECFYPVRYCVHFSLCLRDKSESYGGGDQVGR